MSIHQQRIQSDRYTVIPRTLCFLFHEDKVLMIRYGPSKGTWTGKYNGIGGHIEPGEPVSQGAKREIREETGLEVDGLQLCGTVLIDTSGNPGIALFILASEIPGTASINPTSSEEGEIAWVAMTDLPNLDLMEDTPVLIQKTLDVLTKGKAPFSGHYWSDTEGRMQILIETG